MTDREQTDFKWEIIEHIGVLNTYPTGWNKEFNIVKWNDNQAKYDIRDWSPEHKRMTKGITLHRGEMIKLLELCKTKFNDEPAEEKVQELASEPAPQADKVAEEVPF